MGAQTYTPGDKESGSQLTGSGSGSFHPAHPPRAEPSPAFTVDECFRLEEPRLPCGRGRREITLIFPPRWRAGPSQRSLSASAAAPSQREVRLLSSPPFTYILGHSMERGDSNSREPPSSSNQMWALTSVCPRMTTNTRGQTAQINSGLALSPGREAAAVSRLLILTSLLSPSEVAFCPVLGPVL